MQNNIEKRIKNVMSSVFEISDEQINENSSPDTIENWDSLKHMNLVVALEEEFNIEFSDDNITELVNMKLIITVLSDKFKSDCCI
jgi:acyl carrier protein